MTPGDSISSEAKSLLAELESETVPLLQRENLEAYRASLRDQYRPWVENALAKFHGEIEQIEIAGVPCRQLTPSSWSQHEDPCIQYAFGGGYISGSTYEDLIIAAPLAQYCRARIVMVEYRLSPEHPYPGPQRDMQQVYNVMLEVYGTERLSVCGESAGGNLVLGLLLHARDSGLLMPSCAALLSPWCDLADSHDDDSGRDPTLNKAWIESAAAWHAAGHALDDPAISPLYGDFTGLPSTLITTGGRDLLRGMSERLAARLRRFGVDCELRLREGLWHVYEFYPIPEAEESLREISDFIRAQS